MGYAYLKNNIAEYSFKKIKLSLEVTSNVKKQNYCYSRRMSGIQNVSRNSLAAGKLSLAAGNEIVIGCSTDK